MSQKQLKRILGWIGLYAMVVAIFVFSVFPFYYAVLTSLKSGAALFQVDYFPYTWKWDNYISLLSGDSYFLRNLGNSVVVSFSVVVLSIFFGVTAAFALGRVKFAGRTVLLLTVLGVSMFPQVAVLSGMFELVRALNLYNNLLGLIIAYMISTLPFTVWVLTTFMRDLPKELEEAAIMDGATPWITITQVFMPLMWPALVTTGLLAFITAWNEFLFALTFTLTNEMRTVPVAIALISGSSQYELPWGNIMAASVLVTIPLIVLVLIFQRRIVSGLTAGAVKG